MSWLSSAIKGVGHAAGSVLSNPLVDAGLSFIPGVGPIAAGAAAGIGNLIKPGGNIGSAIKGGVTSGALGGLAGHIPGLQGVSQFLGGSDGSPGLLGQVGSFLTGNGGKNALGLAEGANAAMLQSKANDYAKNALGTATQSYNERAPLRSAGVQGMLNPGAGIAPRIAALTANSSNPFTIKPPTTPTVGPAGY